ncbi:MAG: hypothetical protein H7Z38_24010 [Rubrivivax sp.]|nr:hypothetical protein [Pyrinomonadaceae bacterium]
MRTMRTRGSHFVIFFLILAVMAAGLAVLVGRRSRSRSVSPALAMSEPAAPRRSLAPLPARPLSSRLQFVQFFRHERGLQSGIFIANAV